MISTSITWQRISTFKYKQLVQIKSDLARSKLRINLQISEFKENQNPPLCLSALQIHLHFPMLRKPTATLMINICLCSELCN
ncbi:hypothetical protein V6N13_073318 [Hibiscus sabdariffa]